MFRILMLTIAALLSSPAFGSARILEFWTAAKVESERLTVEVHANRDTGDLESLTLTMDGKSVNVPKDKLKGISAVVPMTIELEWGCGAVSLRHPELDERGVSCQNISVQFDDGPDERPDWYEAPRATFTFSGGKFIERSINRKVSYNTWSWGVE
jgi:hypothetical protein